MDERANKLAWNPCLLCKTNPFILYDGSGKAVLKVVRKIFGAREYPQWSSLNPHPKLNQAKRQEQIESLAGNL
jgi:hypothetical protein